MYGNMPYKYLDMTRRIAVHWDPNWEENMAHVQTVRVPSKADRLEARIDPDQKRLIERAAELRGTTLTDFIVSKMREAAVETIRDYETLQLRDESREVFVAALLNPPEPNEVAKRAAARYKQEMGL